MPVPATITLSRPKDFSAGCARPLKVLVDGREMGTIAAGERLALQVSPGRHRVQVRQDTVRSDECPVTVEEGASRSLECGSYIRGWMMLFIILWFWRPLVPGKLFFVKATGRAS